ncbi:unnamed protein product, partial [Ectocarpus sp. 4 AP-2014]
MAPDVGLWVREGIYMLSFIVEFFPCLPRGMSWYKVLCTTAWVLLFCLYGRKSIPRSVCCSFFSV